MDRRKFIAGMGLSAIAAASPVSVNAVDRLTRNGRRRRAVPRVNQVPKTGKLKLSFFPYELKLRHAFNLARYSRTTTPDVLVIISYGGETGYGEAATPPYLGQSTKSVEAFLQKVDLGRFADPFCLEDIMAYVNQLSPGDSAAKAAVDIALHDLVGKLIGQPWHRLWGYDPAKAPSTTFTIGIDTPEVVREKTLECCNRFNILKVKLGRDNDKEMIEAVRSVTDLPLAVDVNQGWSERFLALDMIYWLKEQGVVMVEQPLPVSRVYDTAWLSERSPLPVFADESVQGVKDLMRIKGVFTGVNIKLMKCGGLREAHKMVDIARAMGMKVMLGCMTETSCGISAAAQLSPAVDFADLDGNLLITNDCFQGVEVEKGRLVLGDRPGIGIKSLSSL